MTTVMTEQKLNFKDVAFFNDTSRFFTKEINGTLYLFDQNTFEIYPAYEGLKDLIAAENETSFNKIYSGFPPEEQEIAIEFTRAVKEVQSAPPYDFQGKLRRFSLKLNIGTQCNLNCSYCFGEKTGESLGDKTLIFKAIDSLIHWAPNAAIYSVCFNLTSEPLLHLPLMEEIQKYIKPLRRKWKKEIELFFITNGTLFDKKILKMMKKSHSGGTINISIDGPREVHDRHRQFRDGRGSYDEVMKTVDQCLKKGLTLKAESVITPEYPYPKEIAAHLLELGFKDVNMKPIRRGTPVSFNPDNLEALKKGYRQYFQFLTNSLLDEEFHILGALAGDYALRPLKRILFGHRLNRRCYWGINMVSMDHKGDYYPCDAVSGNETFKVGSVNEGLKWENIQTDLSCEKRTPCSTCWAKYICSGTCPVNSYYLEKDIMAIDPVECALHKFLAEENLNMLFTLMNKRFSFNTLRKIIAHRS